MDLLFHSSLSPLDNTKLSIASAINAQLFMTKVNDVTKTGTNRVLEAGWYVWLLQRQFRTDRRFKRQLQKKFKSWDNFLQEVTQRDRRYWHNLARAGLLTRVIRDFNKLFAISKDSNHLDKDKWQQLYGSHGISYTTLPELTVERPIRSIPANIFKDWTFVRVESPKAPAITEFNSYISSPSLVKAYKSILDKRAQSQQSKRNKAESAHKSKLDQVVNQLEVPMKKKLTSGISAVKALWKSTQDTKQISFHQFLLKVVDTLEEQPKQ
jgi:hypothetical protein